MEEENKFARKRKATTHDQQKPTNIHRQLIKTQEKILGLHNLDLNLSLPSPLPLPIEPPPPPQQVLGASSRRGRHSSGRGRTRAIIKTDSITPPYAWATEKRATLHTMEYLVSQGIRRISGEVQCKKCDKIYMIEYDLEEKFRELVIFILEEDMSHRAHKDWIKPILPKCRYCGDETSCKPVIAEKKRNINWLFLLLGQLLGCCTLEQLKYFCKHTHNHRTGAKDRVLFLCYYTLCRQLDPNGPYHY